MDYRDYFASVHRGPIGVYFYDGDHGYEHQLKGLEIAEPFFGDGCIVLVDDTNWPHPYEATFDFMEASSREYRLLLDRDTSVLDHPTFWNGILDPAGGAEQRTRRAPATKAESVRATQRSPSRNRLLTSLKAPTDPFDGSARASLVSIVIHNDRAGPRAASTRRSRAR